ncbi:16S rRNA m(4)C1402 methyltransferase [Bacteroidales bacterium]|nr:16S rRNA m(4)C1402 methyltransferase [Bacteroidales bacterium]
MDEIKTYHVPVLLQESIDGLNIQADGSYVDLTFGGGGHSQAILENLGAEGKLYGFDQDADAEANIPKDKRFTFVRGNFRFLSNFMDWHNQKNVGGILADLGVSSHHFDDKTRGFSFRFDAALDMRMNKRAGRTASEILNTASEEEIAQILFQYGELRNAKEIASLIARSRKKAPINTTNDFLEVLKPLFGIDKGKKSLAQAFQALRIEVNGEMEVLKEMLTQALEVLEPSGRLVVITYHSLEDRLVKNFFKTGNFEGKVDKDFFGNISTPFSLINNKVITPSEKEMISNSRSRSAKLRIAQKK